MSRRNRTTTHVAIFLACMALPAMANHESAEVLVQQFQQYSAQLPKLGPAKQVRELKMATSSATAQRIAGTAQSLLRRDSFGVVVIDNGEIVFEGYANGASAQTPLQSYSAAKSMTALAVGEALCAGKIKSLDDVAGNYAPAIADTAYGTASVRQLLEYRSGAPDPGGDGYTGIHSGGGFGRMLQRQISLVDLIKANGERRFAAGSKWIYNGLDSESLSIVVRGATGLPLQRWFEATVWQKAGGEFTAGWVVDREGNGLAEVFTYFTTRDYARIGLYALERLAGSSNNDCMNAFMKESANTKIPKGYWPTVPYWGLGMHTGSDGNLWFMGHSGQLIGMNLKNNRVVAATGFRDSGERTDLAMVLLSR